MADHLGLAVSSRRRHLLAVDRATFVEHTHLSYTLAFEDSVLTLRFEGLLSPADLAKMADEMLAVEATREPSPHRITFVKGVDVVGPDDSAVATRNCGMDPFDMAPVPAMP